MPTYYTDPSLTTRGMRPAETLSDILMRMAEMKEAKRFNDLREKTLKLQLQEMERTAQAAEAQRGAMAAGVQPNRRAIVPLPMQAGGAGPAVSLPQTFDQGAALQKMAELDPSQVGGMQAGFATQAVEQQKAKAEWEKLDTQAKIEKLTLEGKKFERMGQLAGMIQDEPSKIAVIQQGVSEGLISAEEGKRFAAQPYTPELVGQWQRQVLTIKEQLDETRKQQEEKRKQEEFAAKKEVGTLGGQLSDFEAAFKRQNGRLPTATELEAHKARVAREGRAEKPVATAAQKAALIRWRIAANEKVAKALRSGEIDQGQSKDLYKQVQDAFNEQMELMGESVSVAGEEPKTATWLKMQKPDGTTVEVHPDDVKSATQKGYKRIQ